MGEQLDPANGGGREINSPSKEWTTSSNANVCVHFVNSEVILNTKDVLLMSKVIDTIRPNTVNQSIAETRL